MKRHVLRMVDAEAAPGGRLDIAGHRVVLIGSSPDCASITAGLRQRGATVEQVPAAEPAGSIERLAAEGPIDACVVAIATDSVDTPSEAAAPVFDAVRQWTLQADRCDTPWLAGLTRLGGAFGFGAEAAIDPLGGAVTGLAKAIRREFPAIRVKVVDAPAGAATEARAGWLLDELTTGDDQGEVGFDTRGVRRAVATVEQPHGEPRVDATLAGDWLVTGGARGVTAEVALELGRRFDCRLHLIGSTPRAAADARWRGLDDDGLRDLKKAMAREAIAEGLRPNALWNRVERERELERNLERFASAGVSATYHACDVTSEAAVAELVRSVTAGGAPLTGVVHAAGVEASCKLASKDPATVRRTIASKCDGARYLLSALADAPPKYFVGFGSTSGRFGGLGQTDYSLASDLLAKQLGAARAASDSTRFVTFHWPAWDGVGMAARPESRVVLESVGMKFMPTSEGAEHVIRELLSDSTEPEVLVLDTPGMLDTDGTMTRRADPTPATAQEPIASEPPAKSEVLGPVEATPTGWRAPLSFDTERDEFLKQHRFFGRPMLPGLVTLDLIVRVAEACVGRRAWGLRNVSFGKGLQFEGGLEAELVAGLETGGVRVELQSSGATYASATALTDGEPDPLTKIDPGKPLFGSQDFPYPDLGKSPMWHGPALRTFRSFDMQHDGGRATINASGEEPLYAAPDAAASRLSVAMMDGALMATGFYGYAMLQGRIGLPRSFDRVVLGRSIAAGETIQLRYFYRGICDSGDRFDLVFLDAAGETVLRIDGYETTALSGTPG